MLTCIIFHIIDMAFLKIDGRRNGIEGFENVTFGSFHLLSGGNGGQRVLGSQYSTTRTSDLKEKRL